MTCAYCRGSLWVTAYSRPAKITGEARDCMRDPDAVVNRIALRRSEISAAQNGEFL